jgi:YVTN family beta-propeller protein
MNIVTYLFEQSKMLTGVATDPVPGKGLARAGAVLAALACFVLLLWGQGANAQVGALAYVANSGSDNVSVISLSTDTVVATIAVGDGPNRIAATPDGNKVYVLNTNSQNVSVIDTSSQAVITTITVGVNPKGLAITPDGTVLYVTNNGSNNISVIDTATDTIINTLPLSAPDGAVCTLDGSELWIGRGGGANAIQIFTVPGNSVDGTISGVIGSAEWMDFLPDGSFAFVNNGCGCCGNLQKISTASNSVVSTLNHGGSGVGLAVAPDGSAIYAGTNGHCGGGGPQVKKINPATNTSVASLLLPAEGPGDMAITPDGNFLYVPVIPLNQVFKVDTSTMTAIATIPVGTTPVDTAIVMAPVDATPPIITPQVSGTLGNNDWYIDDVAISWTVNDDESIITSTSGCDQTIINSDTAGTTLTCEATSAGGTASASVTIKRDATPPTITGSTSPPPNGNGWNNTDVAVTFTCDDTLSGVAACGPDQTLSSEGANQQVTGGASDKAGNSATATVGGINIDKTAPAVSCMVSPDQLWPPDHTLIDVQATVAINDSGSGPDGFILSGASSNEPDEGLGDGDTSSDIQEFDLGQPDTLGKLRAERAGGGSGRIYILTYEGQDAAGNITACNATVSVPHN